MNQRLIIIVSIVLFITGIVGIYFSDPGEGTSADEAQQQSSPQVTYFITKRIMAAGEQLTKDDYEKKVQEATEGMPEGVSPDNVEGYYLTESVHKGTTLTYSLLTKDKPALRQSSKFYRYTVNLNQQYVNNIYGLLPGENVDVYIKFESPKREHDNRSQIYRGESVVKIVKLFKNKKLLTPLMKEKNSLSEDIQSEKRGDLFTIDIELTRSDLKKIYQIENKFEMIIFPAESVLKDKSVMSDKNKGRK